MGRDLGDPDFSGLRDRAFVGGIDFLHRFANRTYALQGCFPCREGWIAISCKTEAQRRALAGFCGIAPDELETSLAGWTREHYKVALMHRLQAAGVPAGAVMNGPELIADPQLRARGSLLAQDRPGLGVKHYPGQPYRFTRAAPSPTMRAPLLGEHIEEILTDLAGLSPDEIAELVINDVTGTVPIAAR